MSHVCPTHRLPLIGKVTDYGLRWACPHKGCTIVSWGHENTTPADEVTRNARKAAHAAFDSLWRGRRALMDRSEAYELLQRAFGLPPEQAHIGLFDRQQCEQVVDLVTQTKGRCALDDRRTRHMKRQYPRMMPARRSTASRELADGQTKCQTCGGAFTKGERIVTRDIQNGPMRGDDDVLFWHARCENPLNLKKARECGCEVK